MSNHWMLTKISAFFPFPSISTLSHHCSIYCSSLHPPSITNPTNPPTRQTSHGPLGQSVVPCHTHVFRHLIILHKSITFCLSEAQCAWRPCYMFVNEALLGGACPHLVSTDVYTHPKLVCVCAYRYGGACMCVRARVSKHILRIALIWSSHI